MRTTSNHNKGFAMIYALLILASIMTSVALTSSLMGLYSSYRLKGYSQGAQARMVATACGESALMAVRNNVYTLGTTSLSISGGNCTYGISGSAPIKIINLTVSSTNFYKRITITTSQVVPVLKTVWVETN